jgi:hypothetical protein
VRTDPRQRVQRGSKSVRHPGLVGSEQPLQRSRNGLEAGWGAYLGHVASNWFGTRQVTPLQWCRVSRHEC